MAVPDDGTSEASSRRDTAVEPWSDAVLELLEDWQRRAAGTAESHYLIGARLARAHIRFGVPVVALTTFIGTSVFATLEDNVDARYRIVVGMLAALAAVLASLQTFLRHAERSEKHRTAAERWAAFRREIAEMRALHPHYLASKGDPQNYLDDLRRRMDEVSAQSPEIPDSDWVAAQRRHGFGLLPQGGDGGEAGQAARD